jgi:SAM-dependent methyltransferase
MEVLADYSWGDGNRLPKLLGSYECELHGWISQILARRYDTILDIGCAEGYYAVGLARSSPPTTRVLGFDINAAARRISAQTAERNGVSERVNVGGGCSIESLTGILSQGGRSFAFFDCEGAELELLRPDLIPALRNTDMLVECHDHLDRSLTDTLYRRLSPTHLIQRVDEGPRDPNNFLFLKNLSGMERALAVCEFRPEMMHWLLCTSNSSTPS